MSSRVVLVSGGNRGIGLAILRSFVDKEPSNKYCLATRTKSSGDAAIKVLKAQNIEAEIDVLTLDITMDTSIAAAADYIKVTYGKLDVLVNNAAIALNPQADGSDFRDVYNSVFNTNVTSVALLTARFMPLLELSDDPRVINISSARASVALQTKGKLPPTASIPYSISKTALNILTLEMQKLHEKVTFYAASPGHCRTALNGFRGSKEPLDGAKVVVELAISEQGIYGSGFWQFEGGEMSNVPW